MTMTTLRQSTHDTETTLRVRSDFPIFKQATSRGKPLIYLDSAATSQKPQVVIDTLASYYSEYNANIHRGVYEIAGRATEAFESARGRVASFINAAPGELVWTRNTTESINLVAYAWGDANIKRGDVILLTELEHHSNLVPWQLLATRTGAELRFIPVDESGRLALGTLDRLLDGCKLLAITHASNTLGTITPIEQIVPRAHAAGALVLVDGAQAAPHFPVDVAALDADFYAFSAHKMLGPTGIGALYAKRRLLERMPPFLGGGDMIRTVEYDRATFNEPPWKFEAGTSNIADAIAFGAAVDYLRELGPQWIREHERHLTGYALERLGQLEAKGLHIYGPRDPQATGGVISFNLADIHAHDIASVLDTEGICVRAGHHCTMPLMEKMGWSSTARASFYVYNTEEDVNALIAALEKAIRIFKL